MLKHGRAHGWRTPLAGALTSALAMMTGPLTPAGADEVLTTAEVVEHAEAAMQAADQEIVPEEGFEESGSVLVLGEDTIVLNSSTIDFPDHGMTIGLPSEAGLELQDSEGVIHEVTIRGGAVLAG